MSEATDSSNNNQHGGNTLRGGLVNLLPTWSRSSQKSGTSRVGRNGATSTSSSSSNTQFATLGDLARSSAGLPMRENDNKAGGSSRLAVGNPERRNRPRVVRDIFRKAAEALVQPTADPFQGSGNKPDSVESPELDPGMNAQPNEISDDQQVAIRDIIFWRDGFSVGDGPLMRYDEPGNDQLLNEINAGYAPPHLLNVKVGQPVELRVTKRTSQHYTASAERSAPGAFPASSTPRVDGTQMKSEVDQTLPTTSVHVRLADGTRLVARMNLHHTVGDIRKFINTSRPGSSSAAYTIQTLFPVRVLDDDSLTIEKAGLKNSVVVQKMIIHRPSSALKEILENALDAGSTSIRVTVKDGGIKLLQVQDNGSGIDKSSLPLLAARFATSKISSFSDLSSLQSYGFRGEALASISHVAHLSVITKVKDDSCAWKAHYTDGVLSSPKVGVSPDPKPCAGNDGTTIIAEDLFYNTPLRLQAMKSASDEYARILDVVTRYAAHNSSVSFTCKKASSASSDISTSSGCTVKQSIGLLYGASIAKALSHVLVSSGPEESLKRKRKRDIRGEKKERMKRQTGKGAKKEKQGVKVKDRKGKAKVLDVDEDDVERMDVSDEEENTERGSQDEDGVKSDGTIEEEDEDVRWKGELYITGVNYHSKKMVFLLFINHRLVESARLKKGVESVYNGLLPKGTYPFVYLSLQIDPKSIDVNVHPTKREVHFLDEEAIIRSVCDAMQEALVKDSGSRMFQYQTLLTGGIMEEETQKEKRVTQVVPQKKTAEDDKTASEEETKEIEDTTEESQQEKKVYSYHKVRTSAKDRTIDSMFPILNKAQVIDVNESPGPIKLPEIEESECLLTSVQSLRTEAVKGRHEGLSEILKAHVFVGVVDRNKCLSLIQHTTKLYIVNHASLAEELFYQLGLRQFGNFGEFRLDPPAPLRTLLSFAVENEDGIEKAGLQKDRVVEAIAEILITRKEMLKEYFSILINDDDEIESIPLLLNGYTPNLDKLPLFLMRLGPEVNWKAERECFEMFLREMAYFYVPGPLVPDTGENIDPKGKGKAKANGGQQDPLLIDDEDIDLDSDDIESEKWQIQHVIFEAMRKHFHAPKRLLERDVVQVASLPALYKVFERC